MPWIQPYIEQGLGLQLEEDPVVLEDLEEDPVVLEGQEDQEDQEEAHLHQSQLHTWFKS